ncbi:hypothetical protein P171DRAFT_431032 [Karstenula rhodostoma CBS 690.94]|uniref:Uncharacterized protein n=1 Tax=Karstenula rhodostoma CBS 690.94 TaxID=1392251 RepID=A0A9P4PM24_9PLEO|nr:hypothetical protein P171DRAFT_431032 [Karstenula rhodostoma CBS 690.94]
MRNGSPYLLQLMLILASAPLLSASIYMTLGRLVDAVCGERAHCCTEYISVGGVSGGDDRKLYTTEVFLYAFDASLMFAVVIISAAVHPGMLLRATRKKERGITLL